MLNCPSSTGAAQYLVALRPAVSTGINFFSISKFSLLSIQSQCRTLLHRNGKGQVNPMARLLLALVMLGLIPKRINPILSPMRCLLCRSPAALLRDPALQLRRLRQYLIITDHRRRT